MRGTIIEAWYDEEDQYVDKNDNLVRLPATAHVYKETKYGTFYGEAVASEEDADIANAWDGFHFAEMQCDIQAYKAKAQKLYERAKGAEHVWNVVIRGTYDSPTPITEDMYQILNRISRQVDAAYKEAGEAKYKYEMLRDMYHDYCSQIIKQRREIRNKQK